MPLAPPDGVPLDTLYLEADAPAESRLQSLVQYLRRFSSCTAVGVEEPLVASLAPLLPSTHQCVSVLHFTYGEHRARMIQMSRHIDAQIANSSAGADRVGHDAPWLVPRLYIVRPSAYVRTTPPKREPVTGRRLQVAYAGPLNDWQKGSLLLAPIVSRAIETGADLALNLYGQAENPHQTKLLQESLRELEAARRVRWNRTLDLAVMESGLAEADIFLLPSRYEGFPAMLPTAMALGCVPVAAQVHSGTPELVLDGQTGLLAPVGDVDAFAACLARLATASGLLEQLAEQGPAMVVQAGCERRHVVSQIRALPDEIAENRRTAIFERPLGLVALPAERDVPWRDPRPQNDAEQRLSLAVSGRLSPPALAAAMLPDGEGVLDTETVERRLRALRLAPVMEPLSSATKSFCLFARRAAGTARRRLSQLKARWARSQ